MLAIGAVAEIAESGEHGFGDFDHVFRRDETNHIRQARESLRIAMAAAHAATDRDVVTDQTVIFHDGNEAEIVGENIHVVHRRNDEGDLKFARQISLAVQRIGEAFVLGAFEVELNIIDPNCVVSLRRRRERVSGAEGIGVHLLARLRDSGSGRRRDVAVDVAASSERGKQ